MIYYHAHFLATFKRNTAVFFNFCLLMQKIISTCFPVLNIRTYSKFIYTILLYLFLCSGWGLCAVIFYLDKTDVVSIHKCWSFFLLTQVKATCKLILHVEPHSSYTQPFYTANHCFLNDTKKKQIWTARYFDCSYFRNILLYVIILLIKPMSLHNYAISYCPCDHHISHIVCCVRHFIWSKPCTQCQ